MDGAPSPAHKGALLHTCSLAYLLITTRLHTPAVKTVLHDDMLTACVPAAYSIFLVDDAGWDATALTRGL